MKREPLTPATEPVRLSGLTFREEAWLAQARKHVAELNALLSERGQATRYAVTVAGPQDLNQEGAGR